MPFPGCLRCISTREVSIRTFVTSGEMYFLLLIFLSLEVIFLAIRFKDKNSLKPDAKIFNYLDITNTLV